MFNLSAGQITFLFTDIEGSTKLWEQFPNAMKDALARHDVILREAIQAHRGTVVKMRGDGVHAAFASVPDALATALAMQRGLRDQEWSETGALRIRIGLHTGVAEERDGDYYGSSVNRAARLASAAHGGQILLSFATQELIRNSLPHDVALRDLGIHRLKDLTQPERIFQVLTPDLPQEFPALSTLDSRPNNLPSLLTPLIGREDLVSAVQALLRSNVRLVTLIGVGGTGKTRLGLQVAAELLDDFSDGAFFVNLAPLANPALVASAIAQTLCLREDGSKSFEETLKDYLHDKQILLLLDNFEQIISGASLVVDLLASCPHIKVLVTSREALRVRGEQEFSVPPLAVPDPDQAATISQIAQTPSVALFVQRAQALNQNFTLTDRNARTIADICVRLEGLPLAIELAAARTRVLSPQMILARLSERFTLLTGGTRDLPARHQTLRNAVAWSYDLLNEDEQALFRWSSVFVGGCSVQAAETICQSQQTDECGILDHITSLVEKSLVRLDDAEPDTPRFTMLETIREYARDKLIESGESEGMRRRHLDFFLGFAAQAEAQLHTSQQLAWLNRLELERDNFRAALDFAAESKTWDAGLQLAGALWWFWYVRGYLGEGRAYLEQMLKADSPDMFQLSATPARIKGLYGVASLAWRQGDYHHAAIWSAQSKAMCEELGDQLGLAWSLYTQGLIAQFQGDFSQAIVRHRQSHDYFVKSDFIFGTAMSLDCLGEIAYSQGDFDGAVRMFEESLYLCRGSGDPWGIAHTQSILGATQIRKGNASAAFELLVESLALYRELGEKSGMAFTLDNLGSVAQLQGDYPHAISLIEEGLMLRREIGNQRGVAASLGHLGKIACVQGDYERAAVLYKESLTLLKTLGDKLVSVLLLSSMGVLAIEQKQFFRAARLLGAADTLRQSIGVSWSQPQTDEYRQYLGRLQLCVDEMELAQVMDEGRVMNLEQAIAYALEAQR